MRPLPVLIALAALTAVGCRTGPDRRGPVPASVYHRSVTVVHGRALVLPLNGIDPDAPPATVRLDDGRTLDARRCTIITPPPTDPPGWLGHTTTPDVLERADLPTHLVIDLPLDAVGQGLWIGPLRLPLQWLPDPNLVTTHQPAWDSPLPQEERSHPALRALLAPVRADPIQRWRARLLTSGLHPTRSLDDGGAAPAAPDSFDDPVLEALAEETESRWQVALARLWTLDPDLTARLKAELVRTVRFDDTPVPFWPTAGRDLDSLLDDLLAPGLSDARRLARARAWLDAQPVAQAWIVDDAGSIDPATGTPGPLIAVVNRSDEPTLAWARPASSTLPPQPTPIPRRSAALIPVSDMPAPRRTPTRVHVRVGRWQTDLTCLPTLRARPPGVPLAPFYADLDLLDALNATSRPIGPTTTPGAAALLRRSGTDDEQWSLFFESAGAQPALLTLWLGPRNAPVAVIRVSPDGTTEGLPHPPQRVPVLASAERWSCQIPIPSDAVGLDGRVLLGMTIDFPRLGRFAFPRPMTPWQREPGRAAIDTSAWSDLHTP